MDSLPTKFVSQPSNSLVCPLCYKLFSDPVISTHCGHTFCRSCVESQLKTRRQFDCPTDKVNIKTNSIVPNRAVHGQLEDLLIYCQHGLYRVDSEDDFQIDQDGCKEFIPLGRRNEHEDVCLDAWIPCPNSSNHCGKFRKRNFEEHLSLCPYTPCANANIGCAFHGTHQELKLHSCKYSANVEWDQLANMDLENSMDGLQAKCLVKAVRNLNERVTLLEKGKEEVLSSVEKCNSNVINLSIKVEKLAHIVEQMCISQNNLMRSHMASQSTSDVAFFPDYRRTVSSIGLNTSGTLRTRSSSGGAGGHSFRFSERKHETWNMPLSFKCVGTFRGHNGVIRALASKGPYIFSGGSDHCIKVWDIKDKDLKNSTGCIATLTEHSGDVHALCTCGRFLYSAGTDKSIKVWNIDNLQFHTSREDAHSDVIGALISTGKYIFSGSYSSIKVWRVLTLELLHTISDIHHWVRAFAIDPKKKIVYSGSHNTIHIWAADEPFASKGNLPHSHGSVYSLAVTDKFLILGTYNQNTHLYDVSTHQYVKLLNGHLGIINDLVTSPSGNFLFTASYDHTIQLWDMIKQLPVQVLSRHEGSVNCMTLRGDMLFTGSEDKEIKVYMFFQGLASKNLMVA